MTGPTPSGIFPDDSWTLAERTNEYGPSFLRIRSSVPSAEDRQRFSTLIRIRWAYRMDIIGKGPILTDQTNMDAFEERIIAVTDTERDWGCCVAVLTENGIREWRFYTPDAEIFRQNFSRALNNIGPYPIEISSFSDPKWKGLAEFKMAINTAANIQDTTNDG